MVVSGSRIDGGGSQIISAGVRKTIQSIKEIVGNHSDIDIYWALKETDMDPNETAQKLLNQDPFHEVKRRRDKKKEVSHKSIGHKVHNPPEPKRHFESAGQGPRSHTISDQNVEPRRNFGSAGQGPRSNTIPDHNVEPRRHFENAGQGPKSNTFSDRNVETRRHFESAGQGLRPNSFSDRNVRRGGYVRRGLPVISREFRVVRDNRANQNLEREMRPASPQRATSTSEQVNSNVHAKGQTGSLSSQKPSNRQNSSTVNGQTDFRLKATDANSSGTIRKETLVEKRVDISNSASRVQAGKPNNSQAQSALSTSVIGVYSSSTDPVHVPSPDSRPSASVGAIKREVGVVGVRKQSSETPKSSVPSTFSNSHLGKEGSTESFRSFNGISKPEHSQTSESVMPSMPVSRSFISNQHNVRPHQQPVAHQKASQPNKEWKPKSSQKPSSNGPRVIGTPTKSASPPADESQVSGSEGAKLQDKLARVDIYENCNVVIAQNIRVPENDRFRLTFGSLGTEFDTTGNAVNGFQAGATEELNREPPPASLSTTIPEPQSDDAAGAKPVDLSEDQVRSSGSDFPVHSAVSEHQLSEKKETPSPQSLDNYADIGLVRDNSPSFAPSDSQHQDPPELQGFTAFDPQTGYDLPYYRPFMDESVRGQGLPSPHEALSSHNANSIPASTVAMVQQQPPHVAQMYPQQVHVSHYANLMPYRQYISPVYVPPMAVPGYSNNPAYPHMSNGNSYLLMPGGGSHLNANSLKYGVQQFKHVPAGSPTGFGNFTNPAGYAMNAPGVVGGATGLEDSSRMKYKDSNLYVPNPQAETSEIWIQNPREHPGMQSTPYYNMPGQTPHAAYMPSHAGHASFNAPVAQSSHMQYPGLYHPPQPAPMASPHHLGPVMPGNVGVGVGASAPGAQAYQRPQLNHMNWTPNF